MILRPETPADRAVIYDIHARAFGREFEAKIADIVLDSDWRIPSLSLVAEDEGRVIGHALFHRLDFKPDGPGNLPKLLTLGPIGVEPDRQRQGVGSRLIEFGVAEAKKLGYDAIVLLGHPEYYPRFGFKSARAHGLECEFPVPDGPFMILPLHESKWDFASGTIVYHPVFSESPD